MMQLRQREVAGLLRELNDYAVDASRPALVISPTVKETLPNGRVTEKRVLTMSEDVAELVRDAERAELADVRQSLGDRLG